jgi:exosortase O
MLLAWIIASWTVLNWFFANLQLHFDFLHLVLLVCILFFWLKEKPFKRLQWQWPSLQALLLMGVSLILMLFLKVYSPIRLFSFVSACAFFYGLLGFVNNPKSWFKGLIPFALLLMTLPFGRHLDVFVGYPLRILSVDVCYTVLKPFLPEINSHSSLLILENRASHIDMDCSGLKGLWVGLISLFLIGWIEKQQRISRWLMAVSSLLLWLVIGNMLRILLLTLIHIVWLAPELDILVHHSTAIFFLLSGVFLAYLLLRNPKQETLSTVYPQKLKASSSILSFSFSSAYLLILILSLSIKTYASVKEVDKHAYLTENLMTEGWRPMALSSSERKIFEREGAKGMKFYQNDLQLILIVDGDWRSQHKPELCYELTGYKIADMQAHFLDNQIRFKELNFHSEEASVFFWFQSGTETTDDFAQKVWQQLWGKADTWTLVSLLDTKGELPEKEIKSLYNILQTPSNYDQKDPEL